MSLLSQILRLTGFEEATSVMHDQFVGMHGTEPCGLRGLKVPFVLVKPGADREAKGLGGAPLRLKLY